MNFNNYVHTSVSSHSIMLASSNTAKLCDFELCSPILLKNDLNHEVNSNISNIYKLNYSSEPEYENVKGNHTHLFIVFMFFSFFYYF